MNNRNTLKDFWEIHREMIIFILVISTTFIGGFIFDFTNWHKPTEEQDYVNMENITYSLSSNPAKPISDDYKIIIQKNEITVSKKNRAGIVKSHWEDNKLITERVDRTALLILSHFMAGFLFSVVAIVIFLAVIMIIAEKK